MDYKKELEEALERAKNLESPIYREAAEIIFPQLKETTDEKVVRIIKQSLLEFYFDRKLSERTNDVDYAECLAWVDEQSDKNKNLESTDEFESFVRWFVEKRTENWTLIPSDDDIHKWAVMILNHAKAVLGYQSQQASEHEFEVGDWCIDKTDGTVFIISKTDDGTYTYRTIDDKEYNCSYRSLETDARLWTIEDAKAGDILASERSTFIFNKEYMAGKPQAYCGVMNDYFVKHTNGCWTNEKCHPATKEQREQLFCQISEAGYKWNAKELKLVEINSTLKEKEAIDDAFTGMMLKQSNQNSVEWTEADESLYTRCLGILGKCKCNMTVDKVDEELNWFKSLKDKIVSQQSIHNWSKEDKNMARLIGNAITTDEASKYLEEKVIQVIDAHAWLYALKERTAPQNWNENDSKMSSYIVAALDAYCRLRKERNNAASQEELEAAINWIHNRLMYLKPKSN